MPRASRSAIRLVRALLGGQAGLLGAGGRYRVGDASLAAEEVRALASDGVLDLRDRHCLARAGARNWLRRQLLDTDPFAAQHRLETVSRTGTVINLAESPLARLAAPSAGGTQAFLERHQVEAGERVRRLAERARLQPRVTMSYSVAHTADGQGQPADIPDMAVDARRELAELPRVLPRECADVVLDVCGLLKGLQTVESERGWPRRSAKLVLRIGLEQLARHYGYAPAAVGTETRRRHAWLGDGARPDRFE